jgi:hypothetical protein
MRAIRKTHRQKGQLEDPYIAKAQPQPRGRRHTIKQKLNFFMTIPGTPDQLTNAAVPWMLKPVEQHTFRPITSTYGLSPRRRKHKSHPIPNPDSTLPKPPQPKSTTQSVMRLQQLTSNKTMHGNDSDEYDSPSDDDDLHFKAQLRNPPEM